MLSVRYKSVEQYNENNFGRASGERSFPVRHGCHPIHESSLDSRGSYVSDSSEKLNRIPPPVWWIGSFEIRTTCSHPPCSCLLTLPAGDNDFLAPRKRARAVYAVYYTLAATIASSGANTHPASERMPDLQNRAAVNNREMKRTRCLFAKIRDRGRSVPLYAACRVWRCDRYMDGIMEGEGRGKKKRRKNRGKKMGTIRKRPLLFGTANGVWENRSSRGVHNFWMIFETMNGNVFLFEILCWR